MTAALTWSTCCWILLPVLGPVVVSLNPNSAAASSAAAPSAGTAAGSGAVGATPTGLADALALLGGFCFALTNALLRRWRERVDGSAADLPVGVTA